MRTIFFLCLLPIVLEAWKVNLKSHDYVKKFILSFGLGTSLFFGSSPIQAAEDPTSFASQLKLVQSQQISAQREAFEAAERDAINKEIKWVEGRLVARSVGRFHHLPVASYLLLFYPFVLPEGQRYCNPLGLI